MIGSVAWDDHGVATLVQARHISATLPVVLCAPHGGNAVDGDQSETLLERPSPPTSSAVGGEGSKAGGGARVSRIADVGTLQLLEEIDRRLIRKCGSGERGFVKAVDAPAAVGARCHRKYVDANRPLEESSAIAVHPSCLRAKEVHECYHGAIETAIRALGSLDCRKCGIPSELGRKQEMGGKKQSRLLLLDVHGQCKFVDKVLIGTCNGKTADLEALNAPGKGFLWHLRRNLNTSADKNGKHGGTRLQPDKRAEEQKYSGEEHEQEWVKREGESPMGERDDGAIEHAHEAEDDDSVVVLPPYGAKEVPSYTGGYTVRRHGVLVRAGSVSEDTKGVGRRNSEDDDPVTTVDAVQLEFGSQFRRTPEARAGVAEAVAAAVFDHLQN